MSEAYRTLTEKEKQTLRLIVRGYDAKSLARRLEISVHTVNERLRRARRKMEVSSSREAARLLLDAEGESPDSNVDKQLGEAFAGPGMGQQGAPKDGADARRRFALIAGGVIIMSIILAIFALAPMSQVGAPITPAMQLAPGDAAASRAAAETAVVQSARRWLELVDEGSWDASWNATGQAFKELNTSEAWAAVSEDVRTPLGPILSRTAIGQESVPAPPDGYELIKFRTSFEGKPEATETLALVREGTKWRVVGYWIS